LKGGVEMKRIKKMEKDIFDGIWSHENRDRWKAKGFGLINLRSRLERANPVSAEIDAKIKSMHSDDRSLRS
jgi:hypothetical protein